MASKRGPTKAQQALMEAREWIEASKEEVHEREIELLEARKQLEMHETIYAVLEKTLTRGPRIAAKKPATKKAAVTKTYERCTQCGNTRRHSFHNDNRNNSYHEFQATVAPAKKSSRAASLATAIAGAKPQRVSDSEGKNGSVTLPTTPVADEPLCTICNHPAEYEDHAQPSPHYHPFATSSPARPAVEKSSASNGTESSTRSLEAETVSASDVAHAVGGE